MNNLITNGIDHSVFDLEWAKRGGVIKVYSLVYKQPNTIHQYKDMDYFGMAKFIDDETDGTVNVYMLNKRTSVNKTTTFLAMAKPSECEKAGIEYIEPPAIQAEIDLLEAQLAEARKDSERLDWVVGSCDDYGFDISANNTVINRLYWTDAIDEIARGKTPREAIDNAMQCNERW